MGKTLQGVLGKALKCISWWRSSSKAMGNVKYLFIAITSRSTLIQSVSALEFNI